MCLELPRSQTPSGNATLNLARFHLAHLLGFLFLVGFFVGELKADSKPIFDQSDVVAAIRKIDIKQDKLYLYSLDPFNRQSIIHEAPNFFYGYPILGKVEITPSQEKQALLTAFVDGVKESTGMEANCFNPRHGLRIIQGSRTIDFVICYGCLSVDAYGFGKFGGFLTSGSPMTTFNGFLDEYHLKKAPMDE